MEKKEKGKPKIETAVYVCSHVFNHEKPILYVCHEDREWQFLCGELHSEEENPHVIGLNHVIDIDPTTTKTLEMPNNWEAYRGNEETEWEFNLIVPPTD
jgi:hypothetical protein